MKISVEMKHGGELASSITWGLFDGRVAYIESVGGNKTVVGWNVVFQSFRHCETVDLREVRYYFRFGTIRIFCACIYIYI